MNTPSKISDRWAKRLWAVIVLFAAVLELRGLFRRNQDDTLSEYAWSKTKNPAVLTLLTGLVAWLVYHFSFGKGVPLSIWDAVSILSGIALGVGAAFVRKGRFSADRV